MQRKHLVQFILIKKGEFIRVWGDDKGKHQGAIQKYVIIKIDDIEYIFWNICYALVGKIDFFKWDYK